MVLKMFSTILEINNKKRYIYIWERTVDFSEENKKILTEHNTLFNLLDNGIRAPK